MRNTWSRVPAIAVVAAVALGLTSCNRLAFFEPTTALGPDHFELRATEIKTTTGTAVYDWTNTGLRARVTHSTTTTSAGFASIVIHDAVGNLVYSSALMPDRVQETSAGASGAWTIKVNMTGFSGTLGFRLDRLP